MINFDFLQFDQTNLWFFVLSAVGLIRERKVLPFVIVAVGNLMNGSLAAVVLSALILWHRMDYPAPKWVQLKDALGYFFLLSASVSHAPFQRLAICLGVALISLSFGAGGLGVIPALLILRQYVPHPPELEILMAMAGIYWVATEALRFAKSDSAPMIIASIETLAVIGILSGLRDVLLQWIEEPLLIGITSLLVVLILVLALLLHFRNEGFWRVYRKTKTKLSSSLNLGDRFISSSAPWMSEGRIENFTDIEKGFDRVFILTVAPLLLLTLIWVLSRGGLN